MTDSLVGRSQSRIDARAKVTGTAVYPGDRTYGNQLWMKTLFAGRPHARILNLDTARAEALPGVVAVFTARDVPFNGYGLQTPDQPVLCGPGSSRPGADVVRFVGDQVALVIAETETIAAQACALIDIEWQDLPVLAAPDAALREDAPPLHPDHPHNVAVELQIVKGDVDAAWADCDVVVEETYHTPPQEHAYLQPEAGSAYLDEEGRVTVHVAGQWAWEDQQQIAQALDLPPERIRVIYDAIGGAFGGREDMSVQIVLALAAWRLSERGVGRPVKTIWSRTESILGHCKRHPMTLHAKWGARRDGTLVAAEVDVVSDAGAYMYTSNKVLNNAVLGSAGPYRIPNVRVSGRAVYTNNLPGGAFRGFGAPQGAFAAECQINRLAAALGISPVEMRLKNLLVDGDPIVAGTPLPGPVTLTAVTEAAAQAGGWPEVPAAGSGIEPADAGTSWRRGRGIATSFKNVGFSFGYQENSWARVVLEGDAKIEHATLFIGGADVGQGHHTVMAQIAATVLGIPIEHIELVVSDTAVTGSSGSASASRLTYMAGNAVKGAAERALARWQDEERPAAVEYTYLAPRTEGLPAEPGTAFKPNPAYGYVAQSVDLAVDTETGQIRIERVVSAHDVGKAVNPQFITGQVEGAVVQAHGYAVLEDFQTRDGHVLTPTMSTYLIPGVLDIPDRVETVILETPDPDGPFGVRGMAEMPYLGIAPAIVAALHDATGVWFTEFPLTPERVLRGLGAL